jgi:hypothetical protein
MILINLRLCDFCNKVSTYGFIEDNKRIRCFEHKDENMIDLVHGNCIYENCLKRAIFNFDKEIYDEELKIEFEIKLRNEVKFNGLDELKNQLYQDKIHAFKLLEM